MEINKSIITVGYFNIPVSGAVMISRQKKISKNVELSNISIKLDLMDIYSNCRIEFCPDEQATFIRIH